MTIVRDAVLDDADFETAVPRGELSRMERLAAARAREYRAGDLFDEATTLGAQSGLGRELGRYGIEEFLEFKAILR